MTQYQTNIQKHKNIIEFLSLEARLDLKLVGQELVKSILSSIGLAS